MVNHFYSSRSSYCPVSLRVSVSVGGDTLLYVTTTAENRKTIALVVNKTDTIRELKVRIQMQWGIPAHQQRLLNEACALDNERSLLDYSVGWRVALHLQRLRKGLMLQQ